MTDYEARVKDILRFIREKDFAAELDPSKRAGWIQERLVTNRSVNIFRLPSSRSHS